MNHQSLKKCILNHQSFDYKKTTQSFNQRKEIFFFKKVILFFLKKYIVGHHPVWIWYPSMHFDFILWLNFFVYQWKGPVSIARNYAETAPFRKIYTSWNYMKLRHFMQCLISWLISISQKRMLFNPFQPSAVFYIETSHLFSRSKQMTCFYMKRKTGLKWVKC